MRFGAAVAVVLAAGCFHDPMAPEDDDDDFNEEVLLCEDAVAQLERCCPAFDAHALRCHRHHHSTGGCDPTITHESPALSSDESKCINDLACGELVQRGVCGRAQDAKPYIEEEGTQEQCGPDAGWFASCPEVPYTTKTSHPPVCP